MYRVFEDRRSAGRALVPELERCKLGDPIILGLPRGGIPLAFEIAVALHAPLDTIVVRKLGVPSQPELAFGAIASGGIRVINDDVVESLFSLDDDTIERVAQREMTELRRREQAYRLDRPYPELGGKDVVLVDGGSGEQQVAVIAGRRRARRLGIRGRQGGSHRRPGDLPGISRIVLRGRPVLRRFRANDRQRGAGASAHGLGIDGSGRCGGARE